MTRNHQQSPHREGARHPVADAEQRGERQTSEPGASSTATKTRKADPYVAATAPPAMPATSPRKGRFHSSLVLIVVLVVGAFASGGLLAWRSRAGAEERAMWAIRVQTARADYERVFAQADRDVLDRFGGANWQGLGARVAEAVHFAEKDDLPAAVQVWEEVTGQLADVIAAASHAHNTARFAEAVERGDAELARRHLREAENFFVEALQIPGHGEDAEVLGKLKQVQEGRRRDIADVRVMAAVGRAQDLMEQAQQLRTVVAGADVEPTLLQQVEGLCTEARKELAPWQEPETRNVLTQDQQQAITATRNRIDEFSALLRQVREVLTARTAYQIALAKSNREALERFGGTGWARIGEIVDDARRASGEEQWAESVRRWREATTLLPEIAERVRADWLKDRYQTAMERGIAAMRREHWNAGAAAFAQALEVPGYEQDETARKHLELCQRERTRATALARVNDALSKARSNLREAENMIGDISRIREHPGIEVSAHAEQRCDEAVQVLRTLSEDDLKAHLHADHLGSARELATRISALRAFLRQGIIAGKAWTVPGLDLELEPIHPGTFQMGSDSGVADEMPMHTVRFPHPFWVGKFEVTQSQYTEIMGDNPSAFKGARRPVENVTWYEAMEFCARLTERESNAGRLPPELAYRLPSEAEWEYACRAGTTGDYAGSLDELGWYGGNSTGHTAEVGAKASNAWGLHDMHGNVREWCLGRYGEYSAAGAINPLSAASEGPRIIRGGSFREAARNCRSARRFVALPMNTADTLGFRIVLATGPRFPMDVVLMRDVRPVSIDGLAPGSRDALLVQQRYADDQGLPLEVKTRKTGIAMRLVPPGTMVADGQRSRVSQVLYMGKFEITQAQWQAVMQANPARFRHAGTDAPVEQVSWEDCQAFCRKLCEIEGVPEGTYRLPTEPEWEFACRAGTQTKFYWGDSQEQDTMTKYCWYEKNANARSWSRPRAEHEGPQEVGRRLPNAFGLHDMIGNVWEWCLNLHAHGSDMRSFRGGSWHDFSQLCGAASQERSNPDTRWDRLGFRIVRVANPPFPP